MNNGLTEKDIIITDRHSDTTFTDCMVIECTDEYTSEQFKQQILDNQEKLDAIDKATLHAGCMGNSECLLCPIQKILKNTVHSGRKS